HVLLHTLVHARRPHPPLHSFPTRRSSDLCALLRHRHQLANRGLQVIGRGEGRPEAIERAISDAEERLDREDELLAADHDAPVRGDRKSTRLNSSHVAISYAVFCLKKKTQS